MKKNVKIIFIISLLVLFFIIGIVAKNYIFNDTSIQLSENDKKQLESFYLPIFISVGKNEMDITLLNDVIYKFNVQGLNEENNGSQLYLKEDIDNVAKKILGEEKSEIFLNQLTNNDIDFDSQNNAYVVYGSDVDIPYDITIKELKKLKNGNLQAKVNYFEFSDNDYFEFIEKYENEHNVVVGDNNLEEVVNLYESQQPHFDGTLEFKELNNDESNAVKYQFVNMK